MLLDLIVENYAVVEQVRVRFGMGLNVLSGETGSGKSIVVDSLGLLMGARASAEMVRTGAVRARISGVFSLAQDSAMDELFEGAGIQHSYEEDLIVEREVSANGKSRAFVANRPVTTAFLRQLAPALGDIHGQNEQQLLFTREAQRDLLDDYASNAALRGRVTDLYKQWREKETRLEELDRNEQEKLRLLDLWSFQKKEIDQLAPRAGEDVELEGERKILQNVTKLQESATAVFESLYDAPESAATQLRQSLRRLDDISKLDASLNETSEALRQGSLLVEEAAYAMRDYLGKLESDPKRLEDVETRLAALQSLRRKYGGTIEEVLAFRENVARQMDEVENASQHRAALEEQRTRLAEEYRHAAGELTASRKHAAEKLGRATETELKGLLMGGTRLRIAVNETAPNSQGVDEVSFTVSPNRGEELKPLEKIASGGELSRIALALKTASGAAQANGGIPTLVFDEVDAGVGGAAAASVGKRLKTLSRSNQVICVTHLAQIAGFADHHFAVSKREKKGRIATEVIELSPDERAQEVGRMLSGEQITTEALRQAEQLIQAGRNS